MEEAPAYGLWSLVIINSAVFIIFAVSFTKPKSKRDWRSFSEEYRRYMSITPAFFPRLSTRWRNQEAQRRRWSP